MLKCLDSSNEAASEDISPEFFAEPKMSQFENNISRCQKTSSRESLHSAFVVLLEKIRQRDETLLRTLIHKRDKRQRVLSTSKLTSLEMWNEE
jgi:hypothetical protein